MEHLTSVQVSASSVLPDPVGPTSKMFDLPSSTSEFVPRLCGSLVVVVYSHRQHRLAPDWPITYWSRISLISRGAGSLSDASGAAVSCISSRMMSLQRSTHSSQINTDGPAISLRTSFDFYRKKSSKVVFRLRWCCRPSFVLALYSYFVVTQR